MDASTEVASVLLRAMQVDRPGGMAGRGKAHPGRAGHAARIQRRIVGAEPSRRSRHRRTIGQGLASYKGKSATEVSLLPTTRTRNTLVCDGTSGTSQVSPREAAR